MYAITYMLALEGHPYGSTLLEQQHCCPPLFKTIPAKLACLSATQAARCFVSCFVACFVCGFLPFLAYLNQTTQCSWASTEASSSVLPLGPNALGSTASVPEAFGGHCWITLPATQVKQSHLVQSQ